MLLAAIPAKFEFLMNIKQDVSKCLSRSGKVRSKPAFQLNLNLY